MVWPPGGSTTCRPRGDTGVALRSDRSRPGGPASVGDSLGGRGKMSPPPTQGHLFPCTLCTSSILGWVWAGGAPWTGAWKGPRPCRAVSAGASPPFLDPSDLCCPGAPASVLSLDLRTVTHKVRSVYTLAASALSRTRTSPPGWVTADCPAVAQCGRGHGTGRLQAAPLTCPLCHPQSNEPLPGRPQRRQDPFSLQVTHSP